MDTWARCQGDVETNVWRELSQTIQQGGPPLNGTQERFHGWHHARVVAMHAVTSRDTSEKGPRLPRPTASDAGWPSTDGRVRAESGAKERNATVTTDCPTNRGSDMGPRGHSAGLHSQFVDVEATFVEGLFETLKKRTPKRNASL